MREQPTDAKELAAKSIEGIAAGAMLVMIAETALPVRWCAEDPPCAARPCLMHPCMRTCVWGRCWASAGGVPSRGQAPRDLHAVRLPRRLSRQAHRRLGAAVPEGSAAQPSSNFFFCPAFGWGYLTHACEYFFPRHGEKVDPLPSASLRSTRGVRSALLTSLLARRLSRTLFASRRDRFGRVLFLRSSGCQAGSCPSLRSIALPRL